ncbi:MAG: nucleotide-binding protein [Deltaproteobacteria bacterium]|nr:MAG: nucleotide-binding protein [Deltaproteobacteria bacterium]
MPRPAGGVHGGDPQGVIAGAVLETIQVSSYTYLRLKSRSGELWAAVPRTDIAVGTHAELRDAALMRSFRSDSLDRTFDEIYFGVLAQPKATPTAASAAASALPAAPHQHGSAAKADVGKVPPAQGDNARTVAQIFAQRTELAGKRVRLRAQVVKVVGGVLGRNWLHLQDGSGTAEQRDHDLVATTQAEVTVGQTVLVEALVVIDKDLGSGYRYSVLLEDATVTPEP